LIIQRLFVYGAQLRLGLNDREKGIEITDSIVEKGNGGQLILRKRELKERLKNSSIYCGIYQHPLGYDFVP